MGEGEGVVGRVGGDKFCLKSCSLLLNCSQCLGWAPVAVLVDKDRSRDCALRDVLHAGHSRVLCCCCTLPGVVLLLDSRVLCCLCSA